MTVLITRISTGIGKAIALTLLNAGHTVFGSARKQEDLKHWKVSDPDLIKSSPRASG